MELIRTHKDLKVYQESYKISLEIYELSKNFPKEEIYSLTSQIRRSSMSVSAHITEAFHCRRYPKSFASKLNKSEAEAAETQHWLDQSLDYSVLKNLCMIALMMCIIKLLLC